MPHTFAEYALSRLLLSLLSIALLIPLNFGCTVFEDSGEVLAEVRDSSLIIHNGTGRTVSYFAGDEDALARITIDFDGYEWPTIKAGETDEIPLEEVLFYSEDTQRLWISYGSRSGDGDTIRLDI